MKDISNANPYPLHAPTCWAPPNRRDASNENEDEDDDEAPEIPARLLWQPVALESEIVAVFDAGPQEGESLEVAFRRKERELTAVFARLSAIDSLALRRRLEMALPGDPIAARFGRLIVERQTRLLEFLADARRRIAIQASKARGVHA